MSGVLEIFFHRIDRGRRHRGSHVVRIPDALIDNRAGQHLRDIGTGAFRRQNKGAGGGRRPLCGRRALSAVFEREPELPFRRTEMRRADGGADVKISGANHERGQHRSLRKGRACAVKTKKRL